MSSMFTTLDVLDRISPPASFFDEGGLSVKGEPRNATIDVSVVSVWRVDLSVSALSLHPLPSRSDRMVANDQRALYSLSC